MLKREDLEFIDELLDKHGDAAVIPARLGEEAVERLGGASPKLALACLEAQTLIQVLIGTSIIDRDGLPGTALASIESALAAAGVEAAE